ncbi:succinate--CoA ligase subunit alpha [bacterium]|nr:succinate--CoA ligase subunit alpha [bacterium]
MSILVDTHTRLVVQGITGRDGSFHAKQMKEYGTQVVAGVTPGKGGARLDGLDVPVFDTVAEAVEKMKANTSVIYVPAAAAADAVLEAADAGIGTVICITEGIPVNDMLRVHHSLAGRPMVLVGPNCPGVISPGKSKVGIMPGFIHKPGRVGLISRSGTLTYEIVFALTSAGIGQSTCVGIGGDPIIGSRFTDLLPRFESDPETDAVVLVGEIGGSDEEQAAAWYAERKRRIRMVAFIAGKSAPPGKRMGHAGAIISGGKGTARDKIETLQRAGIAVAPDPADIPGLVRAALKD